MADPQTPKKLTSGDLAKILSDRFPEAEVKAMPIPAGSRKLGTRKGPHFHLRASIKRPGLDECAGATLIPDSPLAAQIDTALSEIEGQLTSAIESAENHAAEKRRFKAMQERAGGKREKGEALEQLGSR